jgi:large subunit ribosomal protein L15
MKYNDLDIAANKSPKRVGRGIAAGQGKTAGRGTKGQKSRTGSKAKPGFEGGQNPLLQRLPKLHGFRSFAVPAETVYTGELDQFAGKTIDNAVLAEAGLVTTAFVKVKLITKGDVTKKVTVKLQAASESAIAAIEKAGGSFEKIGRAARPASTRKQDVAKQDQAKPKAKKA